MYESQQAQESNASHGAEASLGSSEASEEACTQQTHRFYAFAAPERRTALSAAPTRRNSPLRSSTSRRNPTSRIRQTPFIALSSALKRVGNLLRTASMATKIVSESCARIVEVRSPVKRTDHDQASSSQNGETECSRLLRDERETRSRICGRKASARREGRGKGAWPGRLTVDSLFQVVHDEVEELVETLQCPGHCSQATKGRNNTPNEERRASEMSEGKRTFASASELDPDLLVDVLGEIEDRFSPRSVVASSSPSTSAATGTTSTSTATPAALRNGFSSTETFKNEARLTRASEFMAKARGALMRGESGRGKRRRKRRSEERWAKKRVCPPMRARRLLTRKASRCVEASRAR